MRCFLGEAFDQLFFCLSSIDLCKIQVPAGRQIKEVLQFTLGFLSKAL
jgi:hypothetical protein